MQVRHYRKEILCIGALLFSVLLYMLSGCEGEADIVFLLDSSDQMPIATFNLAKAYIRSLVSKLDIGMDSTRVSLASLAGTGKPEFFLGPDYNKAHIMDAIQRTQYIGSQADVAENLKFVRETMFSSANYARDRVPNILVMFIADSTNVSFVDITDEASKLRNDLNVSIIVKNYISCVTCEIFVKCSTLNYSYIIHVLLVNGEFKLFLSVHSILQTNIYVIAYGNSVDRGTLQDDIRRIASVPSTKYAFMYNQGDRYERYDADIIKNLCQDVPSMSLVFLI